MPPVAIGGLRCANPPYELLDQLKRGQGEDTVFLLPGRLVLDKPITPSADVVIKLTLSNLADSHVWSTRLQLDNASNLDRLIVHYASSFALFQISS